jgi:O-antigen ligase
MASPWTHRVRDALSIGVALSVPWSVSATSLMIVLWLLVCLPGLDFSALRRTLASPIGAFPALLWALGVLGMLWANVPWWDRFTGVGSFHRLLVIPLLITDGARSDNGRRVLGAYLFSCTVLLVFSLVMTLWPLWRMDDPGVPVHDRTSQSAEFTMCAFALGYIAYGFWRSGGNRARAAAALLLAGAFLGDVLFIATSRAELLVAATLIVLAGARAKGLRGAIIGCVAIAALAVFAWSLSGYLRGRIDYGRSEIERYEEMHAPTSIGMRLEWWSDSANLIAEAPLFGHGTGTIKSMFEAEGEFATNNPHNQTITIALQLGLAGVALLYAMWLAQLQLFRAPGLYGWIGLVIVVQNVVGSLFNSHIFDFVNGWTYIWGTGTCGGMLLRGGSETNGLGNCFNNRTPRLTIRPPA